MSDPSTRVRLPGDMERLRCAGCGNLTRFDVTRTRRTREFWHVTLSGDARIEDDTLLGQDVESISCRWCGRNDAIEIVARADADLSADPTTSGDPTTSTKPTTADPTMEQA
jgi:hypothetical protein